VDEISEALECLIHKGLIRAHKAKNATTFYKIAKGT
jgi:hypothetical protein